MINEGIMPAFPKETRIKRRKLDSVANYLKICKTEE